MNTFISIVEKQFTQDDEGFKTETDVTVAEVRAYREGRHGSEKWANMASFSTATDLFQFRVIPGVTVTTDMRILCDGHTFEITSVENVKGRGMYRVAKVQMKMPEDFLMKVSRLADKTDEILPKVLEAGAEIVEDKVRSNLQAVIGSGTKYESRSTGELLRSLGTSPALQDKNGDFNVKVGFSEPRSDGDSNAKIATILEYGKSGQPAKPFLKPARSSSRNACINAMKAKLDEEVEKI